METPNWDLYILIGAGGILSSVNDLSKFARAQFDSTNKDLELTRKQTFTIETYKTDIGLEWIIKRKPSVEWVWHNGGTDGYRSTMLVDTASKNGIVILSNVSAFNLNSVNIDNLGTRLMKTLKQDQEASIN